MKTSAMGLWAGGAETGFGRPSSVGVGGTVGNIKESTRGRNKNKKKRDFAKAKESKNKERKREKSE